MTRMLLVLAVAAVTVPTAHAEEICRDVRVDLIRDWTVCVRADAGPDGASASVYCDIGSNPCEPLSVTVP